MRYQPYKKAALLIPFNDVPHLFVIMNDPDEDGQCLMLMVTSVKENRPWDKACPLKKACHQFVVRPSYMLYRLAQTASAKHIGNMVEKKYYRPKQDVTQAVYDQIRKGLFASEETKPSILSYATKIEI